MGMEIPGIINTGIPPELMSVRHEHAPAKKASAAQESPKAAPPDLQGSLEVLGRTTALFNRRLKFNVNQEINRIVVKVIDGSTDKVIKEIPPEEIQRLVARIREMIGLLVDEKI